MKRLAIGTLLAVATLFCALAGDTRGQEVNPFDISEDDFSLWRIEDANYPFNAKSGCFPVGNGIVFAHLGVDEDFNTLRGVTGPGYQIRGADGKPVYWQDGEWEELGIRIIKGGKDQVKWTSQTIKRIRGMPVVLVSQVTDEVGLHSLTYAPPNLPVIIREFVLKGGKLARAFKPLIEIDLPENALELAGDLTFRNDSRKTLKIYASGHIRKAGKGKWWADAINPGREIRFSVIYQFSHQEDAEPLVGPDEIHKMREETIEWWRKWNEGNVVFETPDAKFNDLMNELPMMIEVQRDAHSGAVSPMVSYHGFWIRDSNGPILTLLLNGKHSEVRQMLEYYRKAVWHLGFSHMLVPLDLEPGEVPGDADFSNIGIEPAEVPSWIVLHHYWYYRYTEDRQFIRRAFQLLKRNLFGMPINATYGAKFHGDETYAHGALYSTYDREESGKLGYPNGYIPTEFFSLDNTLIHCEASLALAEMARAIGEEKTEKEALSLVNKLRRALDNYRLANGAYAPAISEVTGEKWFLPFSNINLSKYWLSLVPLGADDWKDYVWARDAIISKWKYGTTPFSGYSTGHNLAGWLVAAGALNPSEGETFLDRLVELASPEGAWCEVYSPTGEPVAIYGRVNRIRPWESGLNYEAILRYLTGVTMAPDGEWTLSPKLVKAWRSYKIKNVRAGNAIFDLEVKMDEEGFVNMNLDVHSEGAIPRWTAVRRINSLEQMGVQLEKVPGLGTKIGEGKKLLVLTRDNSFKKVIGADTRLRKLRDSQIQVWDIGMPFTIEELRSALLRGNRLRTPFLYIDRKVKDYDRRTFKDAKFWEAEELQRLLVDYERLGGTIIDEEIIKIDPKGGLLSLNLLVVLYTNTFTWKMEPVDIENFHKEIAEWISWMDEVGKGKLQLKLDFLQIDRWLPPLQSGPQGGGVYWMSWKDVEEDLALRGIPRDYYDCFAVFWAWDRDARNDAQQAYGGAAEGPGDDVALLGEPGKVSYFGSAVLRSHPDGVSKVALHEFLHNIDAMFAVAGMPQQFISSDDMAKSMEKLLNERPGAFQGLGYTDEEMRELAEKELRKEAGFPWRTQLIFYRWLLERTPKEDFLRLFPRLGTIAQAQSRRKLYEKVFLPNKAEFYQLAFDAMEGRNLGLKADTITDKDEDVDFFNLEQRVWFGAIEREGADVWRYNEAEIIADEEYILYLDKPSKRIEVTLSKSGKDGEAISEGVNLNVEVGDKRYAFTSIGEGRFSSEPIDIEGGKHEITIRAQKPGFTISPVKVSINVKPSWNLEVAQPLSYPMGRSNEAVLELKSDAPSAEFTLSAKVETFKSQLLSRLASKEGNPAFLPASDSAVAKLEPQGNYTYHILLPELPPGKHTLLVTVERRSNDGSFAFTHRFPLEISAEGVELVIGCAGDAPGTARLIRASKRLSPNVPIIWESSGKTFFLQTDGERYLLPSDENAPNEVYLYRGGKVPVRIKNKSALRRSSAWSGIDEMEHLLLLAKKVETLPTLEAFEGLSAWDIFKPGLAYEVQGNWEGEEDLSGKLGFGYDEGHLYIWGEIKDDQLRTGGTWDSDRINFVFDALDDSTTWDYPDGPTGYSRWAKDDYWIFANLLLEKPEIVRMGGETATGGLGFWGQLKDARAEVESTSSGYRFVLTLPFESLPHLKPEPGTAIGFGTFYSDWDEALTEIMFGIKWSASGGSIIWTYWDLGILYLAR